MTRRSTGLVLALATATVSGFSIYLNGRAVKHFGDATLFTTAKNAVAGLLLVSLAVGATNARRGLRRAPDVGLRLLLLAVVGGSIPFVLFFEGLSRAQATQAAFIQKTLVVWVALLAVPLLRERFRLPHVLAVCLLVAGQAWYAGSVGTVAFGSGEAMILVATLLWAVEVVYVKRLLAAFDPAGLAAARMGLGTVLLVGWCAVDGKLGGLSGFGATQWRWIVISGLLLTAYVATWYAALSRAPAVDVTAVLVFGAVITAALSGVVDGKAVSVGGTALVTLGTAIVVALAARRPAEAPA